MRCLPLHRGTMSLEAKVVGKTSMAASVKFANHDELTLLASTEPSWSLRDLFEQISESLNHLVEKTISLVSFV